MSDWDLVHSYTRKQAIEDGVLIDITDTSKEAGFIIPVAITVSIWNELIVPTEDVIKFGQSIEGRLWDTLWMLHVAIKSSDATDQLLFKVLYLMEGNKEPELKELKAVIGPGDTVEPVLTVMFKNED